MNLWADRLFFQPYRADHLRRDRRGAEGLYRGPREAVRPAVRRRRDEGRRPADAGAVARPGRLDRRGAGAIGPSWPATTPGLADIAAYMNVWFLGGAVPQTTERADWPASTALEAWRARVRGDRPRPAQRDDAGEALDVARAAEPAPYADHDAARPAGPGARRARSR